MSCEKPDCFETEQEAKEAQKPETPKKPEASMKPKMATPIHFALVLGIMAAVAGSLLAAGFIGTEDAIKQRQLEDLQKSLAQVLPADLFDNQPSTDVLTLTLEDGTELKVYQARKGESPVASAFEVTEGGYAGPIKMVMGVSVEGEILGVRVLSHTETPGLGDKIEAIRDDWILAFDGLSLDSIPDSNWAVKKDGGQFDQFSGATITPRAVVKGVKRGLELQRDHRSTLAERPESPKQPEAPVVKPELGPEQEPELKVEAQLAQKAPEAVETEAELNTENAAVTEEQQQEGE